jgi:hypothetical protein
MLGLGGEQQLGIHIAAVEHVRAGEEIALRQVVVDGGTHDAIRRGRRCGDHLGDQMGLALITGFGEMHLVTHALDVTFGAIAGLWIVG